MGLLLKKLGIYIFLLLVVFCIGSVGCVGAKPTHQINQPAKTYPPVPSPNEQYPYPETSYSPEPAGPFYPAPSDTTEQPEQSPNEWQLATDPAGLWSFRLPPDWKLGLEAGEYHGAAGSLNISYLPEMAYMQHATRVCEWMANTSQGVGRKAMLAGSGLLDMCQLAPRSEEDRDTNWLVLHHADADSGYAFALLESKNLDLEAFIDSIEKLSVASPTLTARPAPEPPAWMSLTVWPAELQIKEYSTHNVRGDFSFPKEAFILRQPTETQSFQREIERTDQANLVLKPFGYQLVVSEKKKELILLRNGQVNLDEITWMSKVQIDDLGKNFTIFVRQTDGSEWLIRKGETIRWNGGYQLWRLAAPLFERDGMLVPYWVPGPSQIEIRDRSSTIFTYYAIMAADNPVKGFYYWQDKWLLEVNGFLIQEGENLNQKFGYEEIFGWQLLNNQPFYYFRQGPWTGISFAGKTLPLSFEEIFHYGCCGYGMYNNGGNNELVWFFGLRDGKWSYVEISVIDD